MLSITQQTFICSNSTIETPEKGVKYLKVKKKTPEKRQRHRSGVFFNTEHISYFFLVFLLSPFNR